ncbi:MAG TPA: tetratricopeptide repeat protein, partial [Micromonosporaceae bacterium]|nr:tetratricopeptide repeat protein [Micromonosporaceae bacterium]
LQQLYTAILRHDPVLVPVDAAPVMDLPLSRPAQLPPPVGHFTGRAGELRALDGMLHGTDCRIAVISGLGGMGKTALAVQWGHRVRREFPDGQLLMDLQGHDSAALTPTAALTAIVRSLGVPGEQIPVELAELTGLYRTLLDGKRVLVVLDNAASADQVRPLVPASPTAALVITSRLPLTALATYHAVRLTRLAALDDDEALALLRTVAGSDRVDAELDQAAKIVVWCGGMPLALRIAAAKLAGDPAAPLRDLAAELAGGDRLDALSVDGDSRSVRTVFASAYRTLSEPAARLFRLLGLHPGATFARHLAAALARLQLGEADRALAELAGAYLVTEVGHGRFRFHDLIQLYAAECVRRDEDAGRRTEATERLVDWYLGVADAANRALDRGRDKISPSLRHPPACVPFAPNHQDTLAFLDDERENLPAVVRFATDQGRYPAAWQLTYLLTGFFDSRGRWADRVEICLLGLSAAQRLADPTAESLMRSGLGVAYLMTRQYDAALDCFYPALELARAGGDRRREGLVYNNIATAYAGLRRFPEALEVYLDALAVHRTIGDRLGIALALNNIGTSYLRLGQPELSFPQLSPALALSREIDNPRIEAGVLFTLGEAYLRLGKHVEALDNFRRALDIRRTIGDRRREVDTLTMLGVAYLAQGDHAAAVEQLRAARRLSHDLADQHLVSVSLTQLAQAHLARDELDAAGECLRRALLLRSRMPDAYEEATIHRALAELAERAGQPAVADEHRERAVRLYQKANAATELTELSSAGSRS